MTRLSEEGRNEEILTTASGVQNATNGNTCICASRSVDKRSEEAVSYTHLDVYKRQFFNVFFSNMVFFYVFFYFFKPRIGHFELTEIVKKFSY